MNWLLNLGTRSGMPRYVSFLGILQAGILFVPESIWTALGVEASHHIQNVPFFVQHYLNDSSFKNAMFVFWLMSPITFLANTTLSVVHVNFQGYHAYLARRSARLLRLCKTSDYSLILVALAFLAGYVWATGIYLKEPGIWGNFVPAKSRWAMLMLHGGAVGLVLPAFVAVLITELRANFTEAVQTEEI